MRFCKKCLYPENAKPALLIDETGICSGCRYHEDVGKHVDWNKRRSMWRELVEEIKDTSKVNKSNHDVLIPVSGGKDSFYQVFTALEYGLNPLLVSYNHCFNTSAGNSNLARLVESSGCDHIRYTIGFRTAQRLSSYMMHKCGDLTWHYHAGIYSLPSQVAAQFNISFVLWGEHGFQNLLGMFDANNIVEFTNWSRSEHSMRGITIEDLESAGISSRDTWLFEYPSNTKIAKLGLRGVYLSSYFPWKPKEQTVKVAIPNGFQGVRFRRDRTPNLYSKIEDHANDVHDYLKYLKFGYGRATDDLSQEIREFRISREEAKKIVKHYDPVEPRSLPYYCKFLGLTLDEFYEIAFRMQDKDAMDGKIRKSLVEDSPSDSKDSALVKDYIFNDSNRNLYFNPNNIPVASGDSSFNMPGEMKVL